MIAYMVGQTTLHCNGKTVLTLIAPNKGIDVETGNIFVFSKDKWTPFFVQDLSRTKTEIVNLINSRGSRL